MSKYPIAYDTRDGRSSCNCSTTTSTWRCSVAASCRSSATTSRSCQGICSRRRSAQRRVHEMTGWKFNAFANESPLVHGIWTDNRDVLQLPETAIGRVRSTGPVPAPGAQPAPRTSFTWTRNQNLYTSLLGAGFVMQAEGNARRTKDLEKRAYVVQMQNLVPPVRRAVRHAEKALQADVRRRTAGRRRSISPPTSPASPEAEFITSLRARRRCRCSDTIYVDLTMPRARRGASSSARTPAHRWSSSARKCGRSPATARHSAVEAARAGRCPLVTGGLKSRVIVAPDPQAPVQETRARRATTPIRHPAGAAPGSARSSTA